MMQKLHSGISARLFKSVCNTVLLLFLSVSLLQAQTTISTTASFTNDTAVNLITFNFQNTNSYPVVLTNLEGVLGSYGAVNVYLWYKTSAINGNPGNIETANGWAIQASANIYGIENTTNTTTQPFLNNINLIIPANTTYGIAISATGPATGNLRAGHGLPAFSINAGGCNVISGTTTGYGGLALPPSSPTFSPVGWIGKLTFAQSITCTGTPAAATISGPTAICANAMFTLTSTPYPAGTSIVYQWQRYNTTTLSWDNIPSETMSSYSCPAIGASTQFRLKTSCTSSSTPSYSNIVTVNIGTGLPGGTYTINNNAQSTATNFVSFSDAAAAMQCGITGPVTLNVDAASGPYTEKVTFNNIPGTSTVNKIRINGRGRILQYAATDNTYAGTLTMNGTKYMTIDSLTIRSLNVSMGVGIVMGDTAKYDSITHCFIDMRSLNVTNGATAGIALSNDYYTANTDNGSSEACYIGYNYILGGKGAGGPYYGVVDDYYYNSIYQNQTDTGNTIEYNTIENVVYGGVMTGGDNGTSVAYNDIHRTTKASTSYFVGIRVYAGDYNNNATPSGIVNKIKIVGNRIHNPSNNISNTGFMGIYVLNDYYYNNTNNNEQTNILIANNAIYNVNSNTASYVYGIYCLGGNNVNNTNTDWDTTRIYHNTIDLSMGTATGVGNAVGIYYNNNYYSGTSNDNEAVFIRNNLVTVTGNIGSNGAYGFVYTNNYQNTNYYDIYPQRNNFYVNNPGITNQFYGTYNTVSYPTMAAFQLANPTMEVGSLNVDPQYTSASTGDLTPLNYALSGNGLNVLADVSTDITGRIRSSAPTPGAFEISSDAGVSALTAPLGTYCSSIKMVSVNIHNYGGLTINSVQVRWSLNGVMQPPVSYSGSIASNGNATINLGNGLFMPSTPVVIKAWTYMPNGQSDGIPANDTLTITTQSSTSVPVNIGPDDSICVGNTLTLNAGYPGSTYMWDNFATTQTRTIQNAGTYYVRLTAFDGCIGVDTMKLYLRPLPVVNLGPDVEICEGSTYTFDAGHPGATYMWDNGLTTQTRTVDTAGVYEAQVTDSHGCTGVGNVAVGMKDMPLIDGINATHADSGFYTFYPLNPRYIINYVWNFGDGSPEASGYMVQHQYARNAIYTVTLKMEGECTGLIVSQSRTVDVFNAIGEGGTGIGNTKFDGDISLYPNPARNMVWIENKSEARMNRVAVYNTLGQLIIDQKADNVKQHQLNTSMLAAGLYSIRIETDKGMFIQKFEVMK